MRSLAILTLVLAACELPAPPPPHVASAPVMDARTAADSLDDVDVTGVVEPAEWFVSHGAKEASLDEYDSSFGCAPIVVGTAREPALLCAYREDVSAGSDDNPVYRVVTHQTVRVVRAGKVVEVLDARTRVESLDDPVPVRFGERHAGIVDLKLTVASDGVSAMIEPFDPATDCKARKIAPGDSADRELRAWSAFAEQWRTRLCNARGRYIWKGQRFAHAR